MDSKRIHSTNNDNGGLICGAHVLPPEVISDILCRLPIETIWTCRAVCKTWYALIQDPCFIKQFSNSCHQSTRLILTPSLPLGTFPSHLILLDLEGRKTRPIPLDKMLEALQIMCTCDGLLCMASAKKLDPVVIYNPITRERLILPPSSTSVRTISSHVVGIGFDRSTNKYKVVRACTSRKVTRFEIISLGERSWRKLNAPERIVDCQEAGVVFWNGHLYWKMNQRHSAIIAQFNLSQETFRMVSFPDYFPSRHVFLGLIEVGGCLTLVQNNSSFIQLWRLTANGVGDDLYFSLQDTYDTHVNWAGGICEFVCALNQEIFLLQVSFLGRSGQPQQNLTWYSTEKIQYQPLGIPGLPPRFKTVCFKPSLTPLPAAASSVPYHL